MKLSVFKDKKINKKLITLFFISFFLSILTYLFTKSPNQTIEQYKIFFISNIIFWIFSFISILFFLKIIIRNKKQLTKKKNYYFLFIITIGLILLLITGVCNNIQYEEGKLILSPGESVRFSGAHKIINHLFINRTNANEKSKIKNFHIDLSKQENYFSLQRKIEKILHTKFNLKDNNIFSILIDKESLIYNIYIQMEIERSNQVNQILLPEQKLFFKNNAIIIDLFMKKFERIRKQPKLNIKKWKQNFKAMANWALGRLFIPIQYKEDSPLIKLDRVKIISPKTPSKNKYLTYKITYWNAGISYTGSTQLVRKKNENFHIKNYLGYPYKIFFWSRLNIDQEVFKSKKDLIVYPKLILPNESFSINKNHYIVKEIIPSTQSVESIGFIESLYYDKEKKLLNKRLDPIVNIIQLEKNKKKIKMKNNEESIFTFVEIFFHSQPFSKLLLVSLLLIFLPFIAIIFLSNLEEKKIQ